MPEMLELDLDANALLHALESNVRAAFRPYFHAVELRRGEVLHHPGEPVERIYFPLNGLVAVLSETLSGESVQTGMIGCDGAAGAAEARGSRQPIAKSVVLVPGSALHISGSAYRQMYDASPALRVAVQRYMEILLTEARQSIVCQALHSVEGRLSRAILDALDRSCRHDSLPLTQEAFAQMLGAQRTTVAVFLSRMQRAGLLRTSRGHVAVADRRRLEQLACDCRATLQFARDEIGLPPGARAGADIRLMSASGG